MQSGRRSCDSSFSTSEHGLIPLSIFDGRSTLDIGRKRHVTDLTHEVVDVRASFNSYPRSLQASLENNRAGPLVDVDHQTWTEPSFQHDFPYIQPDVSDKKYVDKLAGMMH